jgi:hypothetical protein
VQARDERPSGRRAVGGAAAVVALLAVVAFGAAGSLRTDPDANRTAGEIAAFPLLVLLGAAGAAAVISTLLARRRIAQDLEGDDDDAGEGGGSRWLKLALLLLPFAVVGALIFAIAIRPPGETQPDHRIAEPRPAARAPDASGNSRDQWGVVALIGGAVAASAAFGCAGWRTRTRRTRGISPLRGPGAADDPAAAVDAALAELDAEADPRRAIIAAYVRMERALDAAGLGRREPEAPREYLARVAAAIHGDARAARRLTTLYEEARFSVHAVDEGMRADAVEALRALHPEAAA